MTKLTKNNSSVRTKAYRNEWHTKSLGLMKLWDRDNLPSRNADQSTSFIN